MKKYIGMIGSIMALILVSGCGTTDTKEEVAMMSIQDARGSVDIPVEPKRIVDISGNSDILSILGYQVIGTANSDAYDYTKFPTYLEETLQGASILGYSMQDTMDIEAVLKLEPDLIILSTVQEKMYDTLKEVAPTVMVENKALDWKEDIHSLASMFEKEEKANAWITAYEEKANRIGDQIKAEHGEDTSYLSFLASGGQFFIFSGAGFGDVLYQDLHLRMPSNMPAQTDISLPVVTYEGLAQIDADVLFTIATDADRKELQNNAIYNALPAVTSNNVINLPSSPYFNQGYSPIGREQLLDEIEGMLHDKK